MVALYTMKMLLLKTCRGQRGASAVEFALVFPILFSIVYAIVVYSYIYVLQQSITFAAQHSAESAITVDTRPSSNYDDRVRQRVRAIAGEQLSWLNASQRQRILGTDGANVLVTFEQVDGGSLVKISIGMPTEGIFPVISLPFVGNIPPLPAQLRADAIARI